MLPFFDQHYESLAIIHPELLWYQKTVLTVRACLSMVFQRFVAMGLILFDFFPFKVKFDNKKLLDQAIKEGAVFVTVHSGPYPVLGKVISRYYADKQLAVTFYHVNKISFFPIFRHFFKRLGVSIIPLGGAMKEADPILSNGGSMVLFLDAKLPINRTETVSLFGKERQLSTGPYFLAKRYGLKVVPVYVRRQGLTLHVQALPEIPYHQQSQRRFMQRVALSLEQMIAVTLPSWQVFDRFLLD